MTATLPDRLSQLASELEAFPDQRAEILFDVAAELRRRGEETAAIELLAGLVEQGGTDAQIARVELASIHFAAGRDESARAELALVRASRERSPDPYLFAGEVLLERGELEAALLWFNIATTRHSPHQLEAAAGPDGWTSPAYLTLRHRKGVREELGLSPDELDESLVSPPTPGELGVQSVRTKVMRILIWTMPEFVKAQGELPELVADAATHDEYRQRLEVQMREAAADGISVILLVPANLTHLREFCAERGGSPLDDDLRMAYLAERFKAGDVRTWPPQRNDACWCGSGRKYKVCCARTE